MTGVTTSRDTDGETQRQFHEEYPSGWLALTQHQSVPRIVDALLDLPPHREVNQIELAEFAGVSRQSVHRHLGMLLDVGIVEPVPETSPQRYRFDTENPVSRALVELDGAMNAVGGTDS